MNTIDSESLQLMNEFEQRTGAALADIIQEGDAVLFVVQPGQIGKAIGKNGSTLARLRDVMKSKNVDVIEDCEDTRGVIEKTLRGAVIRNVSETDGRISIHVDPATRGIAIGKNGANIKKLKLYLKKKFGVQDAKIV
ncbi:NusA-like transcription termination signal-binding factor [Candidatus Micrarchaeota archaeon]|nr:NusA-like transcription termination signal-binding factor [Candidatus Micrarchaeota archaeon]